MCSLLIRHHVGAWQHGAQLFTHVFEQVPIEDEVVAVSLFQEVRPEELSEVGVVRFVLKSE